MKGKKKTFSNFTKPHSDFSINSCSRSSRRGRPPKQGLSSLSSYEDFNDDDSARLKKYRVDEKDSSSHDDLNGKSRVSFMFVQFDCRKLS